MGGGKPRHGMWHDSGHPRKKQSCSIRAGISVCGRGFGSNAEGISAPMALSVRVGFGDMSQGGQLDHFTAEKRPQRAEAANVDRSRHS
ncbi:uncharacterized protein RCO7_14130 [Rhynchosporium graminicola]|uniref:Uncharacterized protein n=1 Tax=Rhynchosporium graminicola TaxID=2792576 RepID=A0A1E1JT48_9HELO|nr:uncharacterized protein RCO7_14130 [Rhynchosporium commune]